MKEYLKMIRIKHWLKNGLIWLPIFFSQNILKKDYYSMLIMAFFVFSFTSSIIYILNDINDLEQDKLHPIKKQRPIASGKITTKKAYLTMIALGILDILAVFYIYFNNSSILVLIIPILYLILNILYSKGLKNIPIIDVVILVSGFLFRIMYGGLVINVEVSKYLYLLIIFGAFYLGFGKRRNEIIKNGNKSRKVLELYNKEFLDKNMYVALTLAIVSYTLWCVDVTVITRTGTDKLFWTVPLVIVILQKYSLNIEGDSDGDPVEVILKDKILILMAIIYIITMLCILY